MRFNKIQSAGVVAAVAAATLSVVSPAVSAVGSCIGDTVQTLDSTRQVSAQSPDDSYIVQLATPMYGDADYGVWLHVFDAYDGRAADAWSGDERIVVDFLDAAGVTHYTSTQWGGTPTLATGAYAEWSGIIIYPRVTGTTITQVRIHHANANTGGDALSGLYASCIGITNKFQWSTTTTTTTVAPPPQVTTTTTVAPPPEVTTTTTVAPPPEVTTTTTVAPTTVAPTTTSTVPTEVLPKVEVAPPATAVEGNPTFAG